MTEPLREQAARVRVRLLLAHTHAGQALQPGAELEVVQPVADWLRRQSIAEPVPAKHRTNEPRQKND